jgi:hypothetical protein
MPKRSPGKQKPNGEAAGERGEEAPRAAKPDAVLDEEANRQALDEAAGVAEVRRSTLAPPPATRPANAMPLLKPNTREKLLYKIASAGTPLGSDFFDDFPDMQEILALSLSISTRLLIVAICNSELAPTQRISAMRLVAALNGKQLPATEDEQPRPAPHALAVDISSAQRSLDKIREFNVSPASAHYQPRTGPNSSSGNCATPP